MVRPSRSATAIALTKPVRSLPGCWSSFRRSQMRMLLSELPETITIRPSRFAIASAVTQSVCPIKGLLSSWPRSRSQMRMLLSELPENDHGLSLPFCYRQRSHRVGMPGKGLARLLDPLQLPDADAFVGAGRDNHGLPLPFPLPPAHSLDRYAR